MQEEGGGGLQKETIAAQEVRVWAPGQLLGVHTVLLWALEKAPFLWESVALNQDP